MELYIYDTDMTLHGVIDKISSLIWTRRYWAAGEFKLLVPFTDRHVALLLKNRLIVKRGDTEAAEILYVNIKKNSQGLEEIEAQGKFVTRWIGKRIVRNQIITRSGTQDILYRIVNENVISPAAAGRAIPHVLLDPDDADTGSGVIEYTSEPFTNALLAVETAAKAAKLGFRMRTDVRAGLHYFSVYEGRNLTADQTENPPCVFSQEFDNIVEQEYTNSVENRKTTAYVGGEEAEPRVVAEVGGAAAGLDREEVFVNATDITKTYRTEDDTEITRTDAEYLECLTERGASELEQYAETLSFASKINTHANLKYREDYDLGDRVTCVNKRWGIKINVRITEIAETYQQNMQEIDITFGESLPALLTQIRQITK